MRSEPTWLTSQELVELNEIAVSSNGDPHAVLSREMLESSQAKPINHWHYGEDDVAVLAAGLFLEYNGYMLIVQDDELLAEAIIDIITGRIREGALVALFTRFVQEIRQNVVPLPPSP